MSKAKRNDSQGRMRSGLETSEEAFLRQQFDQVSDYVARYPEDERQKRAMEWVMRNAEEYRRKWQQRIASDEALSSRCPDCSSEQSDPLLVMTTNSLHQAPGIAILDSSNLSIRKYQEPRSRKTAHRSC